jgi:hypothetical protein
MQGPFFFFLDLEIKASSCDITQGVLCVAIFAFNPRGVGLFHSRRFSFETPMMALARIEVPD